MASIHASEMAAMRATFPHVVLCSYLHPCDVAVFCSFKTCIQAQASATLARSVIDGSFDDGSRTRHGGGSLRPNGQLAQSRTSARRIRRGQLGGIACAHAATSSSAMP